MIHTYRKIESGIYEVGIWEPAFYDDGSPYHAWRMLEVVDTGQKAALLVSFLNGGESYFPHDD